MHHTVFFLVRQRQSGQHKVDWGGVHHFAGACSHIDLGFWFKPRSVMQKQ